MSGLSTNALYHSTRARLTNASHRVQDAFLEGLGPFLLLRPSREKARGKIPGREATLSSVQAMKEFKDGMDALGNNFPRQALVHLKNAVDLDKTNPFFLSYLGLVIAMVDGNFIEAEDLCDEAVRKQRTQPELYLNLAEVYRLAGKKEDAIDTLITGLKLTKQDARLAGALKKMGMRQPPVLTFLDRGNFLNVQLGKLRYKVLKGRGNKTKQVP